MGYEKKSVYANRLPKTKAERAKAAQNSTHNCRVVVCDRDGRTLFSEMAHGVTTGEVMDHRNEIFDRCRKQYPDGMIYFNWGYQK